MPEKKPPPTPSAQRSPRASPRPAPRPQKGDASLDSTVLAPRPDMTDDTGGVDDGIVFVEDDMVESNGATIVGRQKPMRINTSDISLIEAKSSFAHSDGDFDKPQGMTSFGDGAMIEDGALNPPTEVLRLAFGDASEQQEGDVSAVEPTEPVAVRKWRMGGEDAAQPPAAKADRGDRGGAAMFSLPATDQGVLPPSSGGTRVDAVPSARPVTLDVDELRRTLEETERLLRTVKQQLAGLDLESRGTNAQVAAALHRLGEALAMLKR